MFPFLTESIVIQALENSVDSRVTLRLSDSKTRRVELTLRSRLRDYLTQCVLKTL